MDLARARKSCAASSAVQDARCIQMAAQREGNQHRKQEEKEVSMDICSRCDAPVDTDYDLECYVPDPRHSLKPFHDICICERCREREENEDEHSS